MAGFESTNFGRKTVSTNTTPMKEFAVGEEENAVSEQEWVDEAAFQRQQAFLEAKRREEEVQKLRVAKQKGTLGITDLHRQRIGYLTNIGRQYREVKLDTSIFTLRTLKAKEIKEAFIAASQSNPKNDLELSVEMQRQQLARSLCKIDGHDLEIALGSTDLTVVLEVLDELEENVFDILSTELAKLRAESKEKFEIKNQAEMKGVIEDLKK